MRQVLHSKLPSSPLFGKRVRDVNPHCYPDVRAGVIAFPSGSRRRLFLRPRKRAARRLCLGKFSSSLPVSVRVTTLGGVPTFGSLIVCHPKCTVRCSCFSPARLGRALRSGIVGGLFFTKRMGKAANCRRTKKRKTVTKVGTRVGYRNKRRFALTHSRTCVNMLVSSLIAGKISRPCQVFASHTRCEVLLHVSSTSVELARQTCGLKLTGRSHCQLVGDGGRTIRRVVSFTQGCSVGPTLVGSTLRGVKAAPLHRNYGLVRVLGHPRIAVRGVTRRIPTFRQRLRGTADTGRSHGRRVLRTTRVLVGCRNCVSERQVVTRGLTHLRDVGVGNGFSCSSVRSLSARTHRGLAGVSPRAVTRTDQVPKMSPDSVGILLMLSNQWTTAFRIGRDVWEGRVGR